MRFPTAERVVPELELSDAERQNFSSMARALVDTTAAQYLEYDRVYQQQVNREQWKAVKRREALTVYRERKVSRPRVMGEPQREWKLPALLMVGSIVGTLEDVMYGVATFDAASMLLKTTYTHDELVDGEILSQIRGPTPEDPFQFLGLKWIVKGNPAAVSKLIHPRDLVFLEATGIETRGNVDGSGGSERYGYHLMHSVDLPGYGPLSSKAGVLRGLVSSCIIFKQRTGDASTVNVYMKAKFEPNGKVGESVAVLSAANGLIYCWRSVYCAHHKKLAWLLATENRGGADGGKPNGKACCACGKSERAYRQLTACALCRRGLCSTCRIAKKISFMASRTSKNRKKILRQTLPFCTSCVARASQASALKIARDEVLSGRWDADGGKVSGALDGSTMAANFAAIQLRDESIDTGSSVSLDISDSEVTEKAEQWTRTVSSVTSEGSALSSRRSSATSLMRRQLSSSSDVSSAPSEYDGDDSAASDPWMWTHGANRVFQAQRAESLTAPMPPQSEFAARPPPAYPAAPLDPQQRQLYLQIAQLRDAAENIYQIAMANAQAMNSSTRPTTEIAKP